MKILNLILVLVILPFASALEYVNHDDPIINLHFEDVVQISSADINGSAISFQPSGAANDFSHQSSMTSEGLYVMSLEATDDQNRRLEDDRYEHMFVLDKTPPQLFTSNPANGDEIILMTGELTGEMVFDDIVNTLDVSLVGDGSGVALTFHDITGDTFTFEADVFKGGEYQIDYTVTDIAGNTGTSSIKFNIIRNLEIGMESDMYIGTLPTDLMFVTNEVATCEGAIGSGESSAMTTADGLSHSYDVQFMQPGEAQINVKCILDAADNEATESFDVLFDNTAPVMTITAANITNDYTPSQVGIKLDEEARCTYSETSFDDPSAKPIASESYATHFEINTYVEDNTDYVYYIKCTNKAGHSSTGTAEFYVKKYLDLELEIISPEEGGRSDTDVVVKATTNKNAICTYFLDTDESQGKTSGTFGVNTMLHVSEEIELPIGESVIYVHCEAPMGNEMIPLLKFVTVFVDETAPEVIIIEIKPENRTWTETKIRVHVNGTDDDSEVVRYKYRVVSAYDDYSSGWIDEERNNFILDKDSIGKSLNLSEGTYFVEVKAQNKAGLWSDTMKSDPFVIEPLLKPDSCENKKLDLSKETDVDCGGECGPCDTGMSCAQNGDCATGFCNENKCKAPSCYDAMRNQKESDVDCGGPCDPCVNGKACVTSNDCKSGSCKSRKCAEVSPCTNGLKDEGESDIDCGAICSHKNRLCSDYKACVRDIDCISTNCDNNFCKPKIVEPEEPPFVDTDNDGISDENDKDDDGDGLPDTWEIKMGLDPLNADDAETEYKDGMTYLEQYKIETAPEPPESKKKGISIWIWILLLLLLIVAGAYFFMRSQGYKLDGDGIKELFGGKTESNKPASRPASPQNRTTVIRGNAPRAGRPSQAQAQRRNLVNRFKK